jgi:predicted phosphodiesterase
MKLQFASDLHLEFLLRHDSRETLVQPAPGAELLLLAGDISTGEHAARLFAHWPCPVLLVAGNHELYGTDYHSGMARQARAAGGQLHFLDCDERRFGELRVLGTSLWTDYRLDEPARPQPEAMALANEQLNDHRLIRHGDRAFEPLDALTLHLASRRWLEEKLAEPWPGRTVVMTHHAPHRGSIHENYQGSPINPAFASHLPELVEQADLWVHGHVHNSFDYRVGRCRVVCNPAGYCRSFGRAGTGQGYLLENAEFDPLKVVEV